jgi:acetoin utilization deacetylase AcuC-like enzyme
MQRRSLDGHRRYPATTPSECYYIPGMLQPRPLPPIVYHPAYSAPMPPGHRFPMHEYARLAQVLEEEGLIGPEGLHIAEPASFEMLAAVHDPIYVRQVLDAAVPPNIERNIGMPVTRGVSDRAQSAMGGTC